jgi:hypothetical protein
MQKLINSSMDRRVKPGDDEPCRQRPTAQKVEAAANDATAASLLFNSSYLL